MKRLQRYLSWASTSALLFGRIVSTAALADDENSINDKIQSYLSQMTIQQKLDYIHGVTPASGPGLPNSTGASIAAIPNLGLPEIRTTDGPNGVRSDVPSTLYPAALLLAATWNPDLAWAKGIGVGQDARARGFHIWLGPGMDMYRVPVGGRNSEYICGEDPFLGSQLLVPLIRAVQKEGVVATSKHFVANDQEYNRNSINTIVDERTLREIYLRPFEAAVNQGHSGAFMDAYNQLNGFFCSQSSYLNTLVLAQQWRFDGIRMSDWGGVHNGLEAASAGLDLEMPGGSRALMSSANLYPYFQSGQLTETTIDDKVRRIIGTILRFHFLDRPQLDTSIPQDNPVSAKAGLDSAREGIILLRNDNRLLPLDRTKVKSIAVVGSLANGAPPGEGGSGAVTPIHYTSELAGITQAAGSNVKVDFYNIGNADPTTSTWQYPDSNGAYQSGLEAAYFANQTLSGTPVLTQVYPDLLVNYNSTDRPAVVASIPFSVRWTGRMAAPATGDYLFQIQSDSNIRFMVNGQSLFDNWSATGRNVAANFTTKLSVVAGQPVDVTVEYKGPPARSRGGSSLSLGYASLSAPGNIANYDAVVIAAGFDSSTEGEGSDRTYTMPNYQDTVISNVVAVNPKTVVILHGGGGMDIQQWINQVPGLIHAIFPGEDGGIALGEILFGDTNPSGKLPFTFEKRFQDYPAYPNYPSSDGGVTAVYAEGLFMGYRGFDKYDIAPQFPYGYGLSYTTFSYADLDVSHNGLNRDGKVRVSFRIRNTGDRAGAEVVQLYLGKAGYSNIVRPIRELKGFQKVYLNPGESKRITLELDEQSFAYYDIGSARWATEPGAYTIWVGASSRDLKLTGKVTLVSQRFWPCDDFSAASPEEAEKDN
jgi:beta-glucosidase